MTRIILTAAAAIAAVQIAACGSDSSNSPVQEPPALPTGSITVSITDDPWHDMDSMVLHMTGIEFGHSDGETHYFDMPGGPLDVDMMQLQNGAFHGLLADVDLPEGQYEWMRLHVDPDRSYMDDRGTGGRHGFRMGQDATEGLEVHEPFHIQAGVHSEFMLDFDLRQGVRHHHGGMMGDTYELHSALRLVHMNQAGGLSGQVDPTLIDVNHPACDAAEGGNWVYVFPGDAAVPDDIAEVDSDGVPGPIAADRVDMDPSSGEHRYHFGYLPEGGYRLAFTCSGEWDEEGDEDYPDDPDGRFDFHAFSDPIDIIAGQMRNHDL